MIKKSWLFIFISLFLANFAFALPDPTKDSRVQKVYDYLTSPLIWIHQGQWTACGKDVFEALSHADEEGLWQEDYAPFVNALKSASLSSADEQKKADHLMTLAVLNYISDMKGERLKPKSVARSIHIQEVSIDEADLLKGYLSVPDNCGWLHGLAPAGPEYQHLKQALALYRQKKAEGGWPQLPKGTKLKKGDSGPSVETLRAQLMAQDALPSEGQGGDVFDEALEEGVKKYQDLHGIEIDGVVGPETVGALNTPVDDRLRSLLISMERERWLPNPLPSRYLQVNIAGFYVKAVEGGQPLFYMPIITGKAYTKTPVFNAPMVEVIFNPSWYVPASIAREILPKMQRNPGAFAQKGYSMSGGRIVQSPGPANSLGKIKFNIKNPFTIYLHGTPSQHLFKKAKRSFSHGCIRVEHPEKLAEFVFNDPTKWPLSRIKDEATGSRTKRVNLSQSLPTFITYFTAFDSAKGHMHFVPDVYGQDKKVWEALEQAKRFK